MSFKIRASELIIAEKLFSSGVSQLITSSPLSLSLSLSLYLSLPLFPSLFYFLFSPLPLYMYIYLYIPIHTALSLSLLITLSFPPSIFGLPWTPSLRFTIVLGLKINMPLSPIYTKRRFHPYTNKKEEPDKIMFLSIYFSLSKINKCLCLSVLSSYTSPVCSPP